MTNSPGPAYKWYVVAMLWWIAFFNYADRQAIFSVFPLLQQELHLSALQLGLLGSSFAWVYGLARRSPATSWTASAASPRSSGACTPGAPSAWPPRSPRNFGTLLAFRAAEGLGETFYFPASMSLVSDYHGQATRSRALGFHQTSVYTGTIAGGFFAGLIGQVMAGAGRSWSSAAWASCSASCSTAGSSSRRARRQPKPSECPSANSRCMIWRNPTAFC